MNNSESVFEWIDEIQRTIPLIQGRNIPDDLKTELTRIAVILDNSRDTIQLLPNKFIGYYDNNTSIHSVIQRFAAFLSDPTEDISPLIEIKSFIAIYNLEFNYLLKQQQEINSFETLTIELKNSELSAKKSLETLDELKTTASKLLKSIDSFRKNSEDKEKLGSNSLANVRLFEENIKSINNEIEQKVAAIKGWEKEIKEIRTTDIEEIRKEFEKLKEDISKNYQEFSTLYEKTPQLNESLDQANEKAKGIIIELEQLLNPAIAKNLTETFRQRKEKLSKRKNVMLAVVILEVALSMVYCWLVFSQKDLFLTIQSIVGSFIKLLLPISLFYILFREYIKERTMEEEYAFREAISTSLMAYADQIKSDVTKKDELIEDTVKKLYDSPIKTMTKSGGFSLKKINMKDVTSVVKESLQLAKDISGEINKETKTKS